MLERSNFHQILEEVLFQWVRLTIEITLLILIKKKKIAIKSALSTKLNENKMIFVDTFKIDNFKTKSLSLTLKNFKYKSALFIYSEKGIDKNFKLASSNIPRVEILPQKGINVKDLISYDTIFIEQDSIEEITKRLT